MTGHEWERCEDPRKLCPNNRTWYIGISDRKLRLTACALERTWRNIVHTISSDKYVTNGELLADDLPLLPDSKSYISAEDYLVNFQGHQAIQFLLRIHSLGSDQPFLAKAIKDVLGNIYISSDPYTTLLKQVWSQSPLWNSVQGIAREIYESRNFSLLSILADALEDVGCDKPYLLNHLRDTYKPGHFLGCWALDLILGKS